MAAIYSNNINQQILLALLKEHGIRKIVVSPGGTNPALVISMQSDSFFELYSCIDERSAAYMACGLSAESSEPVMICCTGATASRNYMPALTEAFYRKLPILVLTCSKPNYMLGHLIPQVTNRNIYPADILVEGVHLQIIKDSRDKWDCQYKINKAILALTHKGGGPAHINIECETQECTTHELPSVKPIRRIKYYDSFPEIVASNVCIFIGSHSEMNRDLEDSIDLFCEKYNGVVICDHTSGYRGKYSIRYSLLGTQHYKKYTIGNFDLIIHLGEMSGDYLSFEKIKSDKVWRISEDGDIRILFNSLDFIFELRPEDFFKHYTSSKQSKSIPAKYIEMKQIYDTLYHLIPELPLSQIFIAHHLSPKMPKNSVIHFAILNSLRSWDFFYLNETIRCNCNVGGFGIDGCTSSLIGASLVNREKLYFLFTGDLAFFYDLNSLGNRHIGNNVRILLINDGKGAEFMHFMSPKYPVDKSLFMSAGGHFAKQSNVLLKDYATDLGFEYIQATNKDEYYKAYEHFINPQLTLKPILFEVIISTEGQSKAWELLCNLAELTCMEKASVNAKQGIKSIVNKFRFDK